MVKRGHHVKKMADNLNKIYRFQIDTFFVVPPSKQTPTILDNKLPTTSREFFNSSYKFFHGAPSNHDIFLRAFHTACYPPRGAGEALVYAVLKRTSTSIGNEREN